MDVVADDVDVVAAGRVIHEWKMLRGRKRKIPTFFVPEPFLRGSDSDEDVLPQQGRQQLPQHEEPQHDVRDRVIVESDDESIVFVVPQEEDDLWLPHQQQQPPQEDHHQQHHVLDVVVEEDDPDQQQNYTDNDEQDEDEDEEDKEEEDEEEEDEEEEDEEEDEDFNEADGYETLIEKLSRKWLEAELDHTVSKVASNALWRIASSYFPRITQARNLENITRKLPQFNHIRRKMYDENTPEVRLKIGYRNRETKEMTVVEDTVTPKSRFPPNEFEKLFEIATVKVGTLKI